MTTQPERNETTPAADTGSESGLPGGGAGRRDEVGGSGVHPASAGPAPSASAVRTQAAWGQGERGAAGSEDAGSSGVYYYGAEREVAGLEPPAPPPSKPEGEGGS